jgi:hypothetical protein
MKENIGGRVRVPAYLLAILAALAFLLAYKIHAGNEPVHLRTDWSNRHLLFSEPKTLLDRFRLSTEDRYVQQWVRRYADRKWDRDFWRWHHAEENPLHGDWSVYLGNVGTPGAGNYPAKYSFDVTSANCASATQPDFVIWNANLAGSATAVAAFDTGTFSAAAGAGSTITITNGANVLTMTAGTTNANTGVGTGTFHRGTIARGSATNLATAINIANNGSFVGVSATSSGAVVTITATTAGSAGNSITITAQAASNFTPTFGNFADGASGVPSIVAYDNLYSSCTGTVPSAYWAYNTGGTAKTSVTLSADGSQVAFAQTQAGAANLVILKWAADGSSVQNPIMLTTQASPAAYRACTAPCMYTIPFSGGRDDTNSSVFYDASTDTIYVGDTPTTRGTTSAALHKFTGVFGGTPAEVVGGGWPATLGVEIATSPVYDPLDQQVYVADSNTPAAITGGFLYRVDATAGTVVTSSRLARGAGFTDGPVLDSTNGTIYLYTANYGTAGCGTTNNGIAQMATGFASGATPVTNAQISTTATCSPSLSVYDGDFDNAYYSGGAGHLYVCGNMGGNPTLYQVSVSATGALGAVTTGPTISSATIQCGPVTEFYNSTTAKDYIFLSTKNSAVTGAPINCPAAAGCLMSFDVTSGAAISAATATNATTAVAGGASGVVIDNSSSAGGASQVYYSPLATGTCATAASPGFGGCAIQASQSSLH